MRRMLMSLSLAGLTVLVAIYVARPWAKRDMPVLWAVPAFSGLDQDGTAVNGDSLRGHVWIADFIFTRCTTVCPRVTGQLASVRRSLPGADLRFVSFSVDPEFDTPAVLKSYALGWPGDARWRLFNVGDEGVQNLARGMHSSLERVPDPQSPIVHSSYFFLIDRELNVRGVYDSGDEAALRRLTTDAMGLIAAPVQENLRPDIPRAN